MIRSQLIPLPPSDKGRKRDSGSHYNRPIAFFVSPVIFCLALSLLVPMPLEWLAKKGWRAVFLVTLPKNSQSSTLLLFDSRYSNSTMFLHYEPRAF